MRRMRQAAVVVIRQARVEEKSIFCRLRVILRSAHGCCSVNLIMIHAMYSVSAAITLVFSSTGPDKDDDSTE